MPANTKVKPVQTDLHKYFKTQKSIQNYKSKDLQSAQEKRFKEIDLSRSLIKVEKKHHSSVQLKSNTVSSPTEDAKTVPAYTALTAETVTPDGKSESEVFPTRKRKQQQLQQLEDSADHILENQSAYDHQYEKQYQYSAAKKRLKLEKCTSTDSDLEQVTDEAEESSQKRKLNPEDIKKELGKCGHLVELRSRLLKLNQCETKLNEFKAKHLNCNKEPYISSSSPQKVFTSPKKLSSPLKEKSYKTRCTPPSPYKIVNRLPHLELFQAIDVEVPVSPTKSPAEVLSPLKKSPLITRPACERFSHLAEPVLEEEQLTLPHRYQVMKEVFRAVDTVVSLLHNRQELITFSKLKPAVQEMLRKTFCERHLGQLKTVFPLAYFFRQERVKSKVASTYNATSYQLTVTPNMDYKQTATANLLEKLDYDPATCKYRKMDSIVLVERRHIFHNALIKILQKHHEAFLKSLDPPVTLTGQVRRWHPDFPLDEIDPPEPTPLPQPPDDGVLKSAQEVMETARNLFSVNNRMKNAFQTVATKCASGSTNERPPQSMVNPAVAAALKGVSLSLLEKIRSREAMKVSREMCRSKKDSEELEMLSRLPELARIVRSLFIAEKKAALPWEIVVSKVSCSHSNMLSSGEVEAHLNLLINEVPKWCTVHKVRSGSYLKLDKTRELNLVMDHLNSIIKEKS